MKNSIDTGGFMYPKTPRMKKRKKRRQSIMHRKDGTCYLCRLLKYDWTRKNPLHEHHVIGGVAGRPLSTEYGLVVWLCLDHHVIGPDAVHNNKDMMDFLRRRGREAFEREYPEMDFLEIFGKSCL